MRTWSVLEAGVDLIDEVIETADDSRIAFHRQAYGQALFLGALAAAGGVLVLALAPK